MQKCGSWSSSLVPGRSLGKSLPPRRDSSCVEPINTDRSESVLTLTRPLPHRNPLCRQFQPVAQRADRVRLRDVLRQILVNELGERHGGGCDGLAAHSPKLDVTEPRPGFRRGREPSLASSAAGLVVPAEAIALGGLVDPCLLISRHGSSSLATARGYADCAGGPRAAAIFAPIRERSSVAQSRTAAPNASVRTDARPRLSL
jgi:hypothetical protein